jgi:predicted transposase YdaD
VSPDDLAQIKDEAAWEEVKRDARLEGELEGELRGKLGGLREMLVELARAAGLPLDEGDLARIHACEDVATLQRWALRVVGAKQAADLFVG